MVDADIRPSDPQAIVEVQLYSNGKRRVIEDMLFVDFEHRLNDFIALARKHGRQTRELWLNPQTVQVHQFTKFEGHGSLAAFDSIYC